MIHLIRHGRSIANREFIVGGDSPLTKDGEDKLFRVNTPFVDSVYCSELVRAKETANILYPFRPAKVYKEFNEIYFGKYENRKVDRNFIQVYENNIWEIHKLWGADDVDERARIALEKMCVLDDSRGNIAIVMHDTLMRAVLSRFYFGTIRKMNRIRKIRNGEIVRLEI